MTLDCRDYVEPPVPEGQREIVEIPLHQLVVQLVLLAEFQVGLPGVKPHEPPRSPVDPAQRANHAAAAPQVQKRVNVHRDEV